MQYLIQMQVSSFTISFNNRSPKLISALYYLSRLVGKPTMWFPNRFDTNRPVQAQKRARSLKFRILVEEELNYPSSENKGADQLPGNREADVRFCFRLCRLLVFPWSGSNFIDRMQFIIPDICFAKSISE